MSTPPPPSVDQVLAEQFKIWQKEKDSGCQLKWKEIDTKQFVIRFEFDGKVVPIGYPADSDGMFFMETGEIAWAQRFNEFVLSRDNMQLKEVLTFMFDTLTKNKTGVLTKSKEVI